MEGREEGPSAAIIDSQSVKTGAEARVCVGFDAGKRVEACERHLLCDTLGLVMDMEVNLAGVQDRDAVALVFERIAARFSFIDRFLADAGDQEPRVAGAATRPVEIVANRDAMSGRHPCHQLRSEDDHAISGASIVARVGDDFLC
ncbi:MAG: transposase [Pseudomonadota bacterium]